MKDTYDKIVEDVMNADTGVIIVFVSPGIPIRVVMNTTLDVLREAGADLGGMQLLHSSREVRYKDVRIKFMSTEGKRDKLHGLHDYKKHWVI